MFWSSLFSSNKNIPKSLTFHIKHELENIQEKFRLFYGKCFYLIYIYKTLTPFSWRCSHRKMLQYLQKIDHMTYSRLTSWKKYISQIFYQFPTSRKPKNVYVVLKIPFIEVKGLFYIWKYFSCSLLQYRRDT